MQSTKIHEDSGVVETGGSGAFTAQGPTGPMKRTSKDKLKQENDRLRDQVDHLERMLVVAVNHVKVAWDEGVKAATDASDGKLPPNPYFDEGEEPVLE